MMSLDEPGIRILLVDDEEAFTRNMSKLLVRRGFRVSTADSGEAAVSAVEENEFDVVVLDLKMPGMGGIEALKIIKRKTDGRSDHPDWTRFR